jgi:hypothetical protein
MSNLAATLLDEGRFDEAEMLGRQTLDLQRRVLGPEHPKTLSTTNNLARLYVKRGRYGEAERLSRATLAGQALKAGMWERSVLESILGASLAGQKSYAEAEPLLLSSYQTMRQQEPTTSAPDREELQQAGKWLVKLYQDWGKQEKAAEWREKLRATDVSAAATSPR